MVGVLVEHQHRVGRLGHVELLGDLLGLGVGQPHVAQLGPGLELEGGRQVPQPDHLCLAEQKDPDSVIMPAAQKLVDGRFVDVLDQLVRHPAPDKVQSLQG